MEQGFKWAAHHKDVEPVCSDKSVSTQLLDATDVVPLPFPPPLILAHFWLLPSQLLQVRKPRRKRLRLQLVNGGSESQILTVEPTVHLLP